MFVKVRQGQERLRLLKLVEVRLNQVGEGKDRLFQLNQAKLKISSLFCVEFEICRAYKFEFLTVFELIFVELEIVPPTRR